MILKRMGGAKLTHFTRQELHALLREAKACSERDWLGILVCYWHAMRVSELIALQASDVCDGHIIVTRGKGSERVTYPLMEDADPLFDEKSALEAFCLHKTQNTLLFPVTRQAVGLWLKKYGERAGIDRRKCHPHSLKHSIARHFLAANNNNLPQVQRYLGHKTLGSTGVYLQVTQDEACAAAVAGLTTPKDRDRR